jgi:hypothetical protein
MRTMPAPSRYVLSLYALCLCASFAFSASPRDEALRLVPDDAGICLLVQNLREQAQRLEQSPFADRLAASSIGKLFHDSPEAKKLADLDKQLAAQLNITWAQLRDDILGDAVVLAYTPGPPDKPEQEQGLLIVYARKPALLAALIDRLNEMQRQSGELRTLETRQFGGSSYVRREKNVGQEFYALHGPLLILSDSEARLQKALECDRARPAADRESPAQTGRLQALGVERNLATLWVNPRAFDTAIQQQTALVRGADAAAFKTFQSSWSAIDRAAVSVKLNRDLVLSAVMSGRLEALPASVRKSLDAARKPTAVWSAFPSDALIIAAGRVPWDASDGAAALNPAGFFLGRKMIEDFLRQLGSEWGVCVIGPAPETKSIAPAVLGAIQLSSDSDQTRVVDSLDVLIRFALLGINNQQSPRWRLKQIKQDGADIRVIEGPNSSPGLRPAFAWKAGYLVFSSTPDAILRFNPKTLDNAGPSEFPVARLSFVGWVQYLKAYRTQVTRFAAETHHLDVAEVNTRLDRLIETLALLDTLELTQRIEDRRATITLRLRTTASLESAAK